LVAASEKILTLLARVQHRQFRLAHAATALQVGDHARIGLGALRHTLRLSIRLP
jgi:hypothetical protein